MVSNHLPDLPTSRLISSGNDGSEIRKYLAENIYVILCFMVLITLSALVEICGFFLRRRVSNMKIEYNIVVKFGLFILVSAIWILTDSKILAVFTTNYGGVLNQNAITFVSFICFMLLPIIFLSFFQHIIQIDWLWKIRGLFILNLSAFILLSFFDLPKLVYFTALLFHHLLIYILVIVGLVYCIHNYRNTRDKQKSLLFRGLICFLSSIIIALIVFFSKYPDMYVIMYSVGFFIMIWSMIRLITLSVYTQFVTTERYQSMAYTDTLTALKNRNAFIAEQDSKPVEANTCCIVIDINKLKVVNDTFGHSSGNELIRCSANIIYESFSDIGVCYRIGGDEFATICHNLDEVTIQKRIKGMEDRIAAFNANSKWKIDLACGYAFSNSDMREFSDLFNEADSQMYHNKKRSRSHREQLTS